MIETPISDWNVVVALLFGTTFGSIALVFGVIKMYVAFDKTRSQNDQAR